MTVRGALETQYKEALIDLGLHHPPCEQLRRNTGFYAVGTLAHTLGVAVDLIGEADAEYGNTRRLDANVPRHARTLTVTLLDLCASTREQFENYWLSSSR